MPVVVHVSVPCHVPVFVPVSVPGGVRVPVPLLVPVHESLPCLHLCACTCA